MFWFVVNPFSLIATASNIKIAGGNPSFTAQDFYDFYPQFSGLIPDPVLAQFIGMANVTVLETRWHENWSFGMCLFIAHFCTMYLQTTSGASSPTAQQVISEAQTRGLQTSKSVGDVSVSYDFNVLVNGIEGWAQFKQTSYGFQFASLARMLGKAPVYVW